MENPAVIRAPKHVSKILPIERCSYGGDQQCAVVDVHIHGAVRVIGVPSPAFDGVAALTVVPAVEAGREAALDRSSGISEENIGA